LKVLILELRGARIPGSQLFWFETKFFITF
jgi:hypothetical protein